ncbi:MAG: SLC13 family permease [Coxiella sp. (in: Bacteria)]|nr:MAG: SLC13 family permease [Coxiella sp. (in: g-proteobacteria)]
MDPYKVIIILILAMTLFIWGRWRYDIVALIALFAATAVGAVPLSQIYAGLPNPAVITVACVMVISQTITRSGILNNFISKVDFLTETPMLHIASLSIIAMLLSCFMNNVGALALIMPVAIKTAIKHKRSPSLLLMPIAFASGLGGLTTVIGTPPNLLISSYRQEITGHAFSMFDFTPVGAIVAVAGVLFVIFIGFRLIPNKRKVPKSVSDMFNVEDYIFEVKVADTSVIVDKSLAKIKKELKLDYSYLAIIRNKVKHTTLPKDFTIETNDLLIIQASTDIIKDFISKTKTQLATDKPITDDELKTSDINLMEAVVPQGSRIEGRSTQSLRIRSRFGINLVAISREGKPFKTRLHHVNLKAGDVVLLQGPRDSLSENIANMGFLPLVERDIQVKTSWKMYLPLITFLIAIILTATQLLPVQVAFGGAVLIMVVFNWIPVKLLYEGIDWPIIILLAAMIPIGSALQTTGGTTMIATWLAASAHHMSPTWILLIMMVITMTISDFMNNAATAIVMAPIAVSIANTLHVNIDPFLMGVAVASSCSFLTPVGHQNNTLVMGPGGYKFTDYIRMGLPLELIVLAVSLPTILWIWPLK